MSAPPQLASEWWQSFFDDEYFHIWSDSFSDAESNAQAQVLWELLELHEGSRVLDAGCGYGRLSRPLAERGAVVVGADQSAELLSHAEQNRGSSPSGRLRYLCHDLRFRLNEVPFDAAFNVFTAIGYGTDDDDLAILTTLHDAVRPGAPIFIEVIQRDAAVAFIARGGTMARRRPDGVIVYEEAAFDPVAGRLNGTWHWSGPGTSGSKTASLRIYSVPELVRLAGDAGLRLEATYLGISKNPYKAEPPAMGGRIGLLVRRL